MFLEQLNSQHDTIDVPQTLGNKYFESLKISFKLKPEIHKKTKKVFIIIFFKMGFPSVYLSIGFKVFVFGLIVSTAFYVPTTICHLINVGFYCVNVMFELRCMHEKIVFLCTEYVYLYVWRNVRMSRIYMVLLLWYFCSSKCA